MTAAMVAVTHDEHGRVILIVEETGDAGELSIPVVMQPAAARSVVENLEKHIQMAEGRLGVIDEQEIKAMTPEEGAGFPAHMAALIEPRKRRPELVKILEAVPRAGPAAALFYTGMVTALALHVMELEALVLDLPTHEGERLMERIVVMSADLATVLEEATARGIDLGPPPGVVPS